MKSLAQHIELLLRNNDCVILPGFGGFVAHTTPAYYISEEHLYYPPSRSLSFNAALTMNDGLLVQSYMLSYQVDYARACYMVDIALDKLLDTLDEEGTAILPHIGTLQQDIYGTIQFTPETVGISSPSFFGLSSFLIQDLATLKQKAQPPHVVEQPKGIITHDEKNINLHIDKRVIRQIMSTAAILLLLLMISTPIGKEKPTNIASLNLTAIAVSQPDATIQAEVPTVSDTIFQSLSISEVTTTTVPTAETPIKEPVTTAFSAETEIPTSQVQEVVLPAHPEKLYHIIVASLPNHRGAEETLAQYIAKGYSNASLIERDDRFRISLKHFTEKNAANEFLKELRTNKEFENAWLLAVRNN